MRDKRTPKLDRKKRYLQIALNSTLSDARHIISTLPRSERIILEAGTPFIKRYGIRGIQDINRWYRAHLSNQPFDQNETKRPQTLLEALSAMQEQYRAQKERSSSLTNTGDQTPPLVPNIRPYIVADLKTMDRGETEVDLAREAGASAAIALGHAPTESLNAFIDHCRKLDLDSMIDMMNVEFPLAVLRQLRIQPDVVILHRGVDEERDNKQKTLPLHEIRRIKGNYDTMIAVAGGDTLREVQSSIFNDADIVVMWKDFYQGGNDTGEIARQFLEKIQ